MPLDFWADTIKLPDVPSQWIFHADLDSFYASVEQKLHPELQGKPVIVGPNPKKGASRGVVLTCSYEARKYGVRSAMPISQAHKLCPDAYYSFSGFDEYHKASKGVFSILKSIDSNLIKMSIDEAYLTYPDIKSEDEAFNLAKDVQDQVFEQEELTISIGASHTKTIAKIGSNLKKPNGITIIPKDKFREILDPLSLKVISGIGKKTFNVYKQKGFELIGDVAKYNFIDCPSFLKSTWLRIHGIPTSHNPYHKSSRSHSRERTFHSDESDNLILRKTIRKLTETLLRDIKGESFKTFTIKVRDNNFNTFSRSKTFKVFVEPTLIKKECIAVANTMLNEFLNSKTSFRLLGVKVSNFKEGTINQSQLIKFLS